MKPQSRTKIASMLTEAYHQLGINNVRELDARTNEALEYLRTDREHYIEVADADTPDMLEVLKGLLQEKTTGAV